MNWLPEPWDAIAVILLVGDDQPDRTQQDVAGGIRAGIAQRRAEYEAAASTRAQESE